MPMLTCAEAGRNAGTKHTPKPIANTIEWMIRIVQTPDDVRNSDKGLTSGMKTFYSDISEAL
jgi:hypothetical protein